MNLPTLKERLDAARAEIEIIAFENEIGDIGYVERYASHRHYLETRYLAINNKTGQHEWYVPRMPENYPNMLWRMESRRPILFNPHP